MSMTIADKRVEELQVGLIAALAAKTRLEEVTRVMREELRIVDEALEQASEAIYNATLYDPEGERDDAS